VREETLRRVRRARMRAMRWLPHTAFERAREEGEENRRIEHHKPVMRPMRTHDDPSHGHMTTYPHPRDPNIPDSSTQTPYEFFELSRSEF
jgi:hypothetical protein